eukprot:403346723
MKKALVLSMIGFAAVNMTAPVYVNKALALQEVAADAETTVVVADSTTTPAEPTPVADDTTTTTDATVPAEDDTTPVTDDSTTTTTDDSTTTTTDDSTTTPTDDSTTTTDDSSVVVEDYTDNTTDDTTPVEPEGPKVTIRIDKNKVRNFIRDATTYAESEGVQHITSAHRDVILQTANLYKNTAAKIALNFGKKVAPILEDLGELTSDLQVGDECDQHCATACFSPEALFQGSANVFDLDCLADCGCQFKLQKWNEKEVEKASKKFQKLLKKADKLEAFVEDAHNNQSQTNLEYAVSEYEFQLAVHQYEFADFVRNTANTVLKCVPDCVDTCLNQSWVEFQDVPKCLKYCDCEQNVFDITHSDAEYNLPELIDYSENDQQAWSFFKLIQNKF